MRRRSVLLRYPALSPAQAVGVALGTPDWFRVRPGSGIPREMALAFFFRATRGARAARCASCRVSLVLVYAFAPRLDIVEPLLLARRRMVAVAQLVEHLVVVQGAAGSSPVSHPTNRRQRKREECQKGVLSFFVVRAQEGRRRAKRAEYPARSEESRKPSGLKGPAFLVSERRGGTAGRGAVARRTPDGKLRHAASARLEVPARRKRATESSGPGRPRAACQACAPVGFLDAEAYDCVTNWPMLLRDAYP